MSDVPEGTSKVINRPVEEPENDENDMGETPSGSILRSPLAQELIDFKNSIRETMEKRERLPQPMFWAVFGSRLEEVKKVKAAKRLLDSKLGGLD